MKKVRNFLVLALSMILMLTACQSKEDVVTQTKQEKARTVITTDGEVDDMNSVIRALLYSNDMDISGIVLTSS
ncbi:MAG: nucleoside hydrolase-like domain-containing protein, partial [Faecalibacillus sp.]